MERILSRERETYGSRIEPGGDMHDSHVDFMNWARSYDNAKAPTRSLDLHETWMKNPPCPVVRLDSSQKVSKLYSTILKNHVN